MTPINKLKIEIDSNFNPIVNCFPNPVLESLTLSFNQIIDQYFNILLVDMNGRVFYSGVVFVYNNILLNVSQYPPNTYIVNLNIKDKSVSPIVFIKI